MGVEDLAADQGGHLKPWTAAWYRSRKDEPFKPGSAHSVLDVSFSHLSLKVDGKVRDEVFNSQCRLNWLEHGGPDPSNLFPPCAKLTLLLHCLYAGLCIVGCVLLSTHLVQGPMRSLAAVNFDHPVLHHLASLYQVFVSRHLAPVQRPCIALFVSVLLWVTVASPQFASEFWRMLLFAHTKPNLALP